MLLVVRLLFLLCLLSILLPISIATPEKCSESFDCAKTVFGETQCIKGECVTVGGGSSQETL